MPVVVVESPAKAKTINKYLGDSYTVLATYGHVRDLPPKDGSVDPDHGFEMMWEVGHKSKQHVKAIADALKKDNELILATDPDREGEAISWHLEETLRNRKAIKADTAVSRVVFNAITKSAITKAMGHPREVNRDLVDAYLARRALDYLVGFNLSPVLWRKLPGARSAGRVQSVCLRLIVEREMEIEAFESREYWSVKALLATPREQEFEARLTILGGNKLDQYGLANSVDAEIAVQAIESRDLGIVSVEAKPHSRNPSAPFMTSTLQQEASRKLSFSARQTMGAAQRLYEAGLITYMRTDGIDMAPEAVAAARDEIGRRYGREYVPDKPRIYKNKVKNAQEAHECIRPTDMSLDPKDLPMSADDQRHLYNLIWKRTIASQMTAARIERTTVEIASPDGQVGLRATGQVVLFDGFLKIYEESRDEKAADDEDKRLPQISEGEAVTKKSVTPEQHFTQPPPRYSEATLVKKMEELSIGRPSTYATTVTTIQDREYVRKEKGKLIPEEKGRMVTIFLLNFFRKYVGYEFTADLEEELDDITSGARDWQGVLSRFWHDFKAQVDEASELRISEVLDKLDEALAAQLYPPREDGGDPRLCPKCGVGQLHLKISKTGGFIGCGNYPECRYTRSINGESAEISDKILGEDQGEPISLRSGRFGLYVQRGTMDEDNKKPPRASVPKGWDPNDIDLKTALDLLSLPRKVGPHPEGNEMIEAGIGRYGPYVRHGRIYANLDDAKEVFTVGMNRAVELLAEKAANPGRASRMTPLKELGAHPESGGPVNVMGGKYGPYVKWEKVNATIPKDIEPADVTMEMAVQLIAEKQAKMGKKSGAARKKSTAKR